MTETDSNPKAPLDKSTIVSSPVNDRSAAGGPRWRIVATLNTWLGRFYREVRKDQPREQIAQLYYTLAIVGIVISAAAWGVTKFFMSGPSKPQEQLGIIREAIAKDNPTEETSRALQRVRDLVSALINLRSREP